MKTQISNPPLFCYNVFSHPKVKRGDYFSISLKGGVCLMPFKIGILE